MIIGMDTPLAEHQEFVNMIAELRAMIVQANDLIYHEESHQRVDHSRNHYISS